MAYKYEPFDWYQTPLYYDMAFGTETGAECDFLEAVYERLAPTRHRRILEPACGSGRLVAAMAARGYRVTGYDISEGGLAFARARLRSEGLRARLAHGAMESYRPPGSFDMAHCLVSSFRYLLGEAQARAHLACVADALAPGGIYALGFHLSDYHQPGPGRERWVAARENVRVVCNIQSEPPVTRQRRQAMRARLVVETPRGTRRYETRWLFRTYSARQFRNLLARVPALEHVATHDFDYDIDRPTELGTERLDQVVLLRKRGRTP